MSNFEIGDKVDYHSIIGGEITSKDHEIKHIELEPNNFGCDVAWISGKSGCVALEALSINQQWLEELEDDATCKHGFMVGCDVCVNELGNDIL